MKHFIVVEGEEINVDCLPHAPTHTKDPGVMASQIWASHVIHSMHDVETYVDGKWGVDLADASAVLAARNAVLHKIGATRPNHIQVARDFSKRVGSMVELKCPYCGRMH